MSERMDKDGFALSSKPVKSTEDFRKRKESAWYYEQREGLYLVYECCGVTNTLLIPRSQILRYAAIAESV